MKFAIGKAHLQFYRRKYLGRVGYSIFGKTVERLSDSAFEFIHQAFRSKPLGVKRGIDRRAFSFKKSRKFNLPCLAEFI